MAVAKSYKELTQHGEPYEKNGKMYVVIECKNGKHKEVRWYTDQEYAKMYPDDVKPSADIGVCGGRKIRSTKEVLGFKNGYIWIIKGDTHPVHDWLREAGATYRTFWGWSFSSEQELPTLPAGIEARKLLWEDVAYVDEDALKGQSAIDDAVAALIYDESPSQWIGAVGDRLELEVTVVKAIELPNGFYGPSRIHIMKDADENQYTWTTGARQLEVGNQYKLRGTIKNHDKYKNIKQTVLTRCTEVK